VADGRRCCNEAKHLARMTAPTRRRVALPVRSGPQAEAHRQLGPVTPCNAVDSPVGNQRTRQQLGWDPLGPTLDEDLNGPE